MNTLFKLPAIAALATAVAAFALPAVAAPQHGNNDHRNGRVEQRYDGHVQNTARVQHTSARNDTRGRTVVHPTDVKVVVNYNRSGRYVTYRGTRVDLDRYGHDAARQKAVIRAYDRGYTAGNLKISYRAGIDYNRPYWDYRYFQQHRIDYRVWRPYFGQLWLGIAQQIAWQSSYDNNCHPVTRYDDDHGRPALVGATMCYNGYGQAFVVPGSEQVLHWY